MLKCGTRTLAQAPFLMLTLRMLSSSPSSSSTSWKSKVSVTAKPTSSSISRTPFVQLPNLFPNSHFINLEAMALSRCFSGLSDPITVSIKTEMKNPEPECDDSQSLVVVSFYKFTDFPDHAKMRKPLKELCQQLRVSGGIILAPEGINGSICGIRKSVEAVLVFIQSDNRLQGLRQVESPVSPEEEAIHNGHSASSPLAAGEDAPFRWDHVRVKLKKEIVTLGMPNVSPVERVGKYVSPKDWNELISDPNTVVVDVRNDYETRIGKFKGAVDPCTRSFREFPVWVEDRLRLPRQDNQHSESEKRNMDETVREQTQQMPRVAMYCTGGIRCEKATSFLLGKGFKEVYHLEGGILKYLEEVPRTESLWEGDCFVFDKRVSVEHGLVQGNYKLCYGCKQPISDADMEAPEFEYGVSCPHCFASKTEEEKERARARQRQFETWGIIGGPDKGRKPTSKQESVNNQSSRMSSSM